MFILLLFCAGVLIAESMPSEQQERVLELLQQELAETNADKEQKVGFPDVQDVGFPTNPVEQQIETANEQQSRNNGVVYTR